MKKAYLPIVAIFILTIILTACAEAKPATIVPLTRPAVPAAYASKSVNPFAGNADAITKGKADFITNCQPCHGPDGNGQGSNVASLNPKPGKLGQDAKALPTAYMFWRISEGGNFDPFKSQMPPYKSGLSEDKIWQIISYLVSIK